MKKIVNIFTITIILLLTITSCSTECDEPTKVTLKRLNEYVPYTGYDTLKFLYNNPDTQTFIGQGINYFWVRKPTDDTQCPEDHQSLFIQFRNQKNGNTIKMEYVYDWNEFSSVRSTNSQTDFRFYFNGVKFGAEQSSLRSPLSITIGGESYTYVTYFSNSVDTLIYLAYKVPSQFQLKGGILKLKLSSDENYELIK
jgi:hypothetical protein